jgi:ornithine cyclodeaminase/alanine dehydrogenase-like protein (mu-crystallin family)
VSVAEDWPAAARAADIVVTCTTARSPILGADDVRAGTFVAAVGADNPQKHEIDPALLVRARVFVDSRAQAATIGDLHHAIDAGLLRVQDVQAELWEVVAGRKGGRASEDEITVFDSTGVAIEDVAAAALVYERAVAAGRGARFDLASTPATRRSG